MADEWMHHLKTSYCCLLRINVKPMELQCAGTQLNYPFGLRGRVISGFRPVNTWEFKPRHYKGIKIQEVQKVRFKFNAKSFFINRKHHSCFHSVNNYFWFGTCTIVHRYRCKVLMFPLLELLVWSSKTFFIWFKVNLRLLTVPPALRRRTSAMDKSVRPPILPVQTPLFRSNICLIIRGGRIECFTQATFERACVIYETDLCSLLGIWTSRQWKQCRLCKILDLLLL